MLSAESFDQVAPEAVQIGKDVVELLTAGMYISPLTLFREYVQNSADAIDDFRKSANSDARYRGEVEITLDQNARSIKIRDNGAGLPVSSALTTLLSIGRSPKRGTQARGFRGVGRLCGLAYCRELEFRTKAIGDTHELVLTWDCKKIRSQLSSPTYHGDVRDVIVESISVKRVGVSDPRSHYFQVVLSDVPRLKHDILLNEEQIAWYLAQVAPVPYSPEFRFGSKISERISQQIPHLPITLQIDGQQVFKHYRDRMPILGSGDTIDIEDVEFFEFSDVDGGIAAVGWLGHHQYKRSIPSGLGVKGLRARVGDVQVGDSNIFEDTFKEPRFNGWTIGEVYIADRRVKPNARRDNFEVNHHYYNILAQMGPLAGKITHICRSTSVSRNAMTIISNFISDVETRLRRNTRIDRGELSRLKGALERCRSKLKGIADPKKRESLSAKLSKIEGKLSSLKPSRSASVVEINQALALVSKYVSNRSQAEKLAEAIRRLSS